MYIFSEQDFEQHTALQNRNLFNVQIECRNGRRIVSCECVIVRGRLYRRVKAPQLQMVGNAAITGLTKDDLIDLASDATVIHTSADLRNCHWQVDLVYRMFALLIVGANSNCIGSPTA